MHAGSCPRERGLLSEGHSSGSCLSPWGFACKHKLSVPPPQRLGAYLLQAPGVLCKLLTHREMLSGVRNNNRVPFPCSQDFLWLFVRCIGQPRKNVNYPVFLTLFCINIRCWIKLVSDCVPSWRRVWTSRPHLCCRFLLLSFLSQPRRAHSRELIDFAGWHRQLFANFLHSF